MSREARNPLFQKQDEKKGKKRKGACRAKNRAVGSKRFAGFQWRPFERFPVIFPYVRTWLWLVVTSAPEKLPLSKRKEKEKKRETSQMERRKKVEGRG